MCASSTRCSVRRWCARGGLAGGPGGGLLVIVRRTRLLGPQAQLRPDRRHFCLIANRTEDITVARSRKEALQQPTAGHRPPRPSETTEVLWLKPPISC